MVIVWSIRNSASPQELQSQELEGRKAGLERGRKSLHSPSIWGHSNLITPCPPQLCWVLPPASQHRHHHLRLTH